MNRIRVVMKCEHGLFYVFNLHGFVENTLNFNSGLTIDKTDLIFSWILFKYMIVLNT